MEITPSSHHTTFSPNHTPANTSLLPSIKLIYTLHSCRPHTSANTILQPHPYQHHTPTFYTLPATSNTDLHHTSTNTILQPHQHQHHTLLSPHSQQQHPTNTKHLHQHTSTNTILPHSPQAHGGTHTNTTPRLQSRASAEQTLASTPSRGRPQDPRSHETPISCER